MSSPPDYFSVTVSHKGAGRFAGQTVEPTVVWLTGEHDVSNASQLSQVIAETIALDEEEVIVDLSGVSFLGGATIAIFIRANAFLVARSRSLVLRSPQRSAERLLGLCGLTHLLSPVAEHAVVMTQRSEAIRSWVAVPTVEREPGRQSDPAQVRADLPSPARRVTALDDADGRAPQGD